MSKLTIREWAIKTFGRGDVVAEIVEAHDRSGYETRGVLLNGLLYPFGKHSPSMRHRHLAMPTVRRVVQRPHTYGCIDEFTVTNVVTQFREGDL